MRILLFMTAAIVMVIAAACQPVDDKNGKEPKPEAVCSDEFAVAVYAGGELVQQNHLSSRHEVLARVCPVGSGDMLRIRGTIDFNDNHYSGPIELRFPGWVRNTGFATVAASTFLTETSFASKGTQLLSAQYDDDVVTFKVDTFSNQWDCAPSGAGGVTVKCPWRAAEGYAIQGSIVLFIEDGLTFTE